MQYLLFYSKVETAPNTGLNGNLTLISLLKIPLFIIFFFKLSYIIYDIVLIFNRRSLITYDCTSWFHRCRYLEIFKQHSNSNSVFCTNYDKISKYMLKIHVLNKCYRSYEVKVFTFKTSCPYYSVLTLDSVWQYQSSFFENVCIHWNKPIFLNFLTQKLLFRLVLILENVYIIYDFIVYFAVQYIFNLLCNILLTILEIFKRQEWIVNVCTCIGQIEISILNKSIKREKHFKKMRV